MTARKTDFRLIMESKADGSYIGIPTSILVGERTDFTHKVSKWLDKYNVPENSVDSEYAVDLLFSLEQKTGRRLDLYGRDEGNWALEVFPKVKLHVEAVRASDFGDETTFVNLLGVMPESDITENEIAAFCSWLNQFWQ